MDHIQGNQQSHGLQKAKVNKICLVVEQSSKNF